MIYLQQNTGNIVNVTLWENSTNQVNPYFTWKIVNKQSLNETIFYTEDFSQAPWYYNSFTVSVYNPIPVGFGATSGYINIEPGEYTYNVYQMNNPYDLDINNSIKEVETGILVLVGTFSGYETYTYSVPTYSVYQNMDRI